MLFRSERRQLVELAKRKRQGLFDEDMRAGPQCRLRRLMMQPGRTRDIDKIRSLTIEHQFEVIIHADIFDEVDSFMPPLRDGIVNGADRDILARTPAGKMRAGGNLAKSRNSAA